MLSGIWVIAALACSCLAQQAAPVVDLVYSQYQGYYNATWDQNIYRGSFCCTPRREVEMAIAPSPTTEQKPGLPGDVKSARVPPEPIGAWARPPTNATSGDEDCLFLNVYVPANATKLPVFMFIHGGGYGLGSVRDYDWSQQIRTNENSYIVVDIQYRLGAFGFLSSAELAHFGTPNAGIHDIRFALQWIQKYIRLFGGDPAQVTIGGESAGGGAVMLLAMAKGGSDEQLFNGVLASSPYLPTQWAYDGAWPSESYSRFAEEVGCRAGALKGFGSVFDCLVAADTATLQIASDHVSSTLWRYGQWAFIPVTDGSLVRERPTAQLLSGKLNGVRVLSTNTLNEGVSFMPQGITNESAFTSFLHDNYPLLSPDNITSILGLYRVPSDVPPIQADSDGLHAPFSTTNSIYGFGWQQAANNLYGEATFVCPSYWLANAFAQKSAGQAWRYQYSVSPAAHAMDMDPVHYGPEQTAMDVTTWAFRAAMQRAWGNFIVHGVPGLAPVRGGELASNISQTGLTGGGRWSPWLTGRGDEDHMLNLNMTGGVAVPFVTTIDGRNITIAKSVQGPPDSAPPLQPVFSVVGGYGWEYGRGKRCQLLADLGPWLME